MFKIKENPIKAVYGFMSFVAIRTIVNCWLSMSFRKDYQCGYEACHQL